MKCLSRVAALGVAASAAGLGLLGLPGCATAYRGVTEKLVIESDPPGAAVRLSNGFTGRTPVTFTIARKGDVTVTVTKEGHEPAAVVLRPRFGASRATQDLSAYYVVGAAMTSSTVAVASGGELAAAAAAAEMTAALAVTSGLVIIGGVAVDVATGAMLSHASGPIRFVLKPRSPGPPGGVGAPGTRAGAPTAQPAGGNGKGA